MAFINAKYIAGFAAASLGAIALVISPVSADPDDHVLSIDGEVIATDVEAPDGHPLDHLYSGWRYRNAETQALQLDDFENPAFVQVDAGEEAWNTAEGSEGKSCADCHGDASESMAGVRAAFPKWNANADKPKTLENQINICRTEQMGAEAYGYTSTEMVNMVAYVGLQSRGMPVAVSLEDGGMAEWAERGKEIYYTRTGQLNMACATCHEDNQGNMIRADHLSQGQINGFPTYRLKSGALVALHSRFKGCVRDTRATPYKPGGDEFVALEVYLGHRGNGLMVETPSVRQ